MIRTNVWFFINICSRTSLEDIEDEEKIEEYESEDNTDIEKKVKRVLSRLPTTSWPGAVGLVRVTDQQISNDH